jgi:hypothetical protein
MLRGSSLLVTLLRTFNCWVYRNIYSDPLANGEWQGLSIVSTTTLKVKALSEPQ